jgi:UDP-N-acetylmuramyl pentapeptide phosphotransferase/UDP-N-acetylglucosamine-1-phosphate transferase
MSAHNDLVSAKANLLQQVKGAAFHAAPGRSQNQVVRFWIITMMLVSVGLPTLKLR